MILSHHPGAPAGMQDSGGRFCSVSFGTENLGTDPPAEPTGEEWRKADRQGEKPPLAISYRNQSLQQSLSNASVGESVDKILVLIVEDDVLIQLELEATLHDGGYSTEAETSGEAAIAKLEATPAIRALITDINLISEVTGWDVARRARELFPDLPVIYVTSVAAEEWTSQGVPKSILISKPFAPTQITTAISQLLNAGDAPPSPQ
jgi:CheY-like chemotaxis protein